MKLLTFALPSDGDHRLGLLSADNRVLDLKSAAERTRLRLPFDPGSMLSLIEAGEAGLAAVAIREQAEIHSRSRISGCRAHSAPAQNVSASAGTTRSISRGREVPPGRNCHSTRIFNKAVTAVTGPFDPIPYDGAISGKWDWEAELGVVIGKRGKNITEAQAGGYVFGYTVVNDVSVRDLQRRHGGQWHKGKSLDGTCPFGPWIVTADEIDPGNLRIMTRVNGVTKQDSNTRHMYFKIPRIIAELSLGMTLEPGDLISTGTPQGVGFARTPPEYLKPGDVMETEVEGIGCLRNPIGA